MSKRLGNIARRWRQTAYPPAFRIYDAPAVQTSLAEIFDVIGTNAEPSASGLPRDFAIDLSNQLFRVKRNLESMAGQDADSREIRMLHRALKAILKQLSELDVECVDPTGQPFDAGRLDFEMVGDPEIREGLAQNTIVYCERPIVLIAGSLAQKGRGIVAKPA